MISVTLPIHVVTDPTHLYAGFGCDNSNSMEFQTQVVLGKVIKGPSVGLGVLEVEELLTFIAFEVTPLEVSRDLLKIAADAVGEGRNEDAWRIRDEAYAASKQVRHRVSDPIITLSCGQNGVMTDMIRTPLSNLNNFLTDDVGPKLVLHNNDWVKLKIEPPHAWRENHDPGTVVSYLVHLMAVKRP
jgi:hypothetical protein